MKKERKRDHKREVNKVTGGRLDNVIGNSPTDQYHWTAVGFRDVDNT